ncbi:LacI family DNA-binding transcriptional regulator [Psychromonas sp.]|uniref:LacI family DNA-binding transcriptional regulator n=1 Tax=Psychromonas sp. TaxID=1884585 RepID=UPI0035691E7F
MKKVKLSDIAKRANVTSITVSRALSNPEKVKQKTREKIQKLAQEMGYIPNMMAKGLKSSSKTIGVIVPTITNPFFSNAVRVIVNNANKRGYNCLFFTSDESAEIEQNAVNTLLSYNVDGVIIGVISEDENYAPEYFNKLKSFHIPVVLFDRNIDVPHTCGVYLDNVDSGYKLGKEIMCDDYDDILVVSGSLYSRVANARLNGLKMAFSEKDKMSKLDIIYADFNAELSKKLVADFLKKKKPSIIVGLNNQITLGALEACVLNGYVLSVDMKFYSIDEIQTSKNFGVSIPCIKHDIEELGYQSVTQLIRAIEADECGELSDIIIRGSIAK